MTTALHIAMLIDISASCWQDFSKPFLRNFFEALDMIQINANKKSACRIPYTYIHLYLALFEDQRIIQKYYRISKGSRLEARKIINEIEKERKREYSVPYCMVNQLIDSSIVDEVRFWARVGEESKLIIATDFRPSIRANDERKCIRLLVEKLGNIVREINGISLIIFNEPFEQLYNEFRDLLEEKRISQELNIVHVYNKSMVGSFVWSLAMSIFCRQ